MNSTFGVTPSIGKADRQNTFYLNDHVDRFIYRIKEGLWLAVPFVAAFISIKWAFAIISVEFSAYWISQLLRECNDWLFLKSYETDADLKFVGPSTELEILLERLRFFENKYCVSIADIHRLLERGEVPIQDNLDYIEMVSLVNQLSLKVGEYFEEKGNEKL